MKKLVILGIVALVVVMALAVAAPVAAASPQEVTIEGTQQQTRYYPDGSVWHILAASPTSFELTLTGKALHGEMSYAPSVTDLHGERYALVYDKKADLWRLNLGVIQYTSPHSGLTIKEQWEGYLKLDADLNLIEGEFIQHGYVVGDPTADYSWAEPVAGEGLWLLGWSVYTYTPVP